MKLLSKKKKRAILSRARQLVERRWIQGGFTAKRGERVTFPSDRRSPSAFENEDRFRGYCLAGALCKAAIEEGVIRKERGASFYEGWEDVIRAVDVHAPTRHSPTLWNDTPGRTKAEVLEVIDRALAGL